MVDQNETNEVIKNFEVKEAFEGKPHKRHEFTCEVNGQTYKGYFYDDAIQWLQPHPKQMLGKKNIDAIEAAIYYLLSEAVSHQGLRRFM